MAKNSTLYDLSKINNTFAIKLYKAISSSKDTGENILLSPYSIHNALSMCYAGAENNTANQLKQLLNYEDLDKSTALGLNKMLLEYLETLNNKTELNIANKIYAQDKYSIKDEFLNTLRSNFKSDVELLDYSNGKNASQAINKWVSQQTKQKIQNIINENAINELTRVILINAIYFKGTWLHKFNETHTSKEPFYLNDGSSKQVSMMKMFEKQFKLLQNLDKINANICEFPYVGQQISMSIILPNQGTAVDDIIANLDGNLLTKILTDNHSKSLVNAYIPKFKFEETINLSNTLKSMNASEPFDENKADFSGISDDKPGLYISSIVHKSLVEVNEKGTEAVACTAVKFCKRKRSAKRKLPEEFRCDHPFIFIIHDNENKTVLFIGKYSKPNE